MKRFLSALLLLGASFPPDSGVVDVRNYGAVANDGISDWAAFQAAERDAAGVGRVHHVPGSPGDVYDIDAPVKGQILHGNPPTLKWVASWVVKCDPGVVLRIPENSPAFANAAAPQSVLVFGSTDGNAPSSIASGGGDEGFRNSVIGCTIDRGATNPGAHGIDWVCNNRGVIRGVSIIGGGRDSISMARAYPGPCLIADTELVGGQRGLHLTQVQYGMTLRGVRMTGQTVAGIDASANLIHAEDLHIEMAGAAAAIKMTSPGAQLVCLHCSFGGGAASKSAIELGADTKAFIRDSSAVGSAYASLVKKGTATVPGLELAEWVSHPTIPLTAQSLRLPELPPPSVFESEDPDDWASPTHYGCAAGDTLDDQACAQQAANSGKPVLYFPGILPPLIPRWRFSGTLDIPCSVRRIVGLETIWVAHTGRPAGLNLLRFNDPSCRWNDTTTVEGFWGQAALAGGAWVEHRDARTLYLRDLQAAAGNRGVVQAPGAGRLFLEDVAIRSVELEGDAWAWQLDLEGLGAGPTSFVQGEGRLRAVGVKTEGLATGGAPTLRCEDGAQCQLLGMLAMPCVGENGAPPQLGFHVEEADFDYVGTNWCSSSFAAAAWAVQVRATQDGVTSEVLAGDLPAFQPGTGWKVIAPFYSTRRAGVCEP